MRLLGKVVGFNQMEIIDEFVFGGCVKISIRLKEHACHSFVMGSDDLEWMNLWSHCAFHVK